MNACILDLLESAGIDADWRVAANPKKSRRKEAVLETNRNKLVETIRALAFFEVQNRICHVLSTERAMTKRNGGRSHVKHFIQVTVPSKYTVFKLNIGYTELRMKTLQSAIISSKSVSLIALVFLSEVIRMCFPVIPKDLIDLDYFRNN